MYLGERVIEGVRLPDVPEPKDVKELVRALMDSGVSPAYAMWLGNRLQKHVWSFWGERLKALGLKWQDFLSVFSEVNDEVVGWVEGRVDWGELLGRLREAVLRRAVAGGRGSRAVGLDRWFLGGGAKVK